MKFISQVLGAIKTYGGLIAAGAIGFLMLLLKRKERQLQTAKVEIEKRDDSAAVQPMKDQIIQTQKEVDIDDQQADEAEAKLRATLNAPNGPGPDCGSR